MNELNLNILGFPAANRDLSIELRDPVSRDVVHTARPFLDGTARVSKIPPGAYELTLRHPNLALPVLTRPVRVLPTGATRISVLIDPSRFRDSPIEDIPEANLTPVRETAASVAETMTSLSDKRPGEAILAEDWNQLASNVRDLSLAVAELTRLISPTGHDHPELIRKFDEVTSNFQTLVETLSTAMTELQRRIQIQQLRQEVTDMLTFAEINPESARGQRFLSLIDALTEKIAEPPEIFARELRNVSVRLSTLLEELLQEKAGDEEFVESDVVRRVGGVVEDGKRARSTNYEAELKFHRKVGRKMAKPVMFFGR